MLTANHNSVWFWVSKEEVEAATVAGKAGKAKCCKTCRGYGAPGFLMNANQWVNCFSCNPTQKKEIV